MAAVRTMAFICDAWMWPTLVAVKADGGEHILDVLPAVWTASLCWLRSAADEQAAVIDGSMQLDTLLGAAGQRTMARNSEGTATRGGHAAMDMNRIRATIEADPDQHKLVCKMLTVTLNAMANALEVHASEFIGDSVFSAVKDMPELHKNLEGVPTTSTPCEALFAAVKRRAVVEGVARHDSSMGVVMAKRDRTTEWARGLPEEQRVQFWERSRKHMRKGSTTMKQQRAAQGEAKALLREIKLAKMRSGREKKGCSSGRPRAHSVVRSRLAITTPMCESCRATPSTTTRRFTAAKRASQGVLVVGTPSRFLCSSGMSLTAENTLSPMGLRRWCAQPRTPS